MSKKYFIATKMVILRGAIIKLQTAVCASQTFSSQWKRGTRAGCSQFLFIRRIKCDSSGGERRRGELI